MAALAVRRVAFVSSLAISACGLAAAFGELGDSVFESLDHPAIRYHQRQAKDPVARLNQRLKNGELRLKRDDKQGYLRSVLEALNVPIESQIAIFSKTSVQARRIEPRNPRTLFFNDQVIVGWVRGGFIELAALDPEGGIVFYTLNDYTLNGAGRDTPVLLRSDSCLSCHETYASLGVPGVFARSVVPAPNGAPIYESGSANVDHRTPFEKRWGGYYVTGKSGPKRHMGNAVAASGAEAERPLQGEILASLTDKFETSAYLAPTSDVVALMVFDHQMQMMNLLTRVGWEVRAALYDQSSKTGERDLTQVLGDTSREIVDYLLFVGEPAFEGKVQGSSGFAEQFAAQAPKDSQGRSLREFDLEKRLFRHPLSYMIYSEAFDSLPSEARESIFRRLWQILSGAEKSAKYSGLALSERRTMVEILRATKKDLPAYFR